MGSSATAPRPSRKKDLDSFYRILVEIAEDAACIVQNRRLLLSNRRAAELLGIPPTGQVDLPFSRFLPAEEAERVENLLLKTTGEEGPSIVVQTSPVQPQGAGRPVEINIRLLPFAKEPTHLLTIRKLPETASADPASRSKPEQWDMALIGNDIGLWDWNVQTGAVIRNRGWMEVLGYVNAHGEIEYPTWEELIHPDDLPRATEALAALLDGETDLYENELRMRAKNGEWRWILDRGKTIEWDRDGRALRVTGLHLDITARKRAEQLLVQNLVTVQVLMDNLPVAVFAKSAKDWTFTAWNKASEKLFGLTAEKVMGKTDYDFFPTDQSDFFRRKDQETFAKRAVEEIPVEEIDSPTRGRRVLHTIKAPIFDDKHQPLFLLGISEDITERIKTEAALRKSETRYRLLADNSIDVVWTMSLDGAMTYISPSITTLTGYTPREAIALPIKQRLTPDSYHHVRELIRKELNNPPAERAKSVTMELQQIIKNGAVMDMEITATWTIDETGKIIGIQGISRDITAKKKAERERELLEKQLRQSQKMETIGTLAGGIAHDFNNILWPILGYADMALDKVPADSLLAHDLQQIIEAANQAKQLVKQILTFSSQPERKRRPMYPHLILKEALRFLEASLPATIEIRQAIASENMVVSADPTQLHQVVMNLCTNAFQAMKKDGGVLDIQLAPETVDAEQARMHASLREGPYVRLTVRDTGVGMDPAIHERIFEPFFTTKEVGEGTGLGLSVVHGIVRNHEGAILVESSPGRGSAFHVYLPRIVATVETLPDKQQRVAPGHGQVLLVDDEQAILELGRRMLERSGYSPLLAADGAQALQLFRQTPAAFDLILTDQVMPVMTGLELAKEIKGLRPDIPVILMTGYSESAAFDLVAQKNIDRLIAKPIIADELINVIREVLTAKKEKGK